MKTLRLSCLGSYSIGLFDPVVPDRYGKDPGFSSDTTTSSFNRSTTSGFLTNSYHATSPYEASPDSRVSYPESINDRSTRVVPARIRHAYEGELRDHVSRGAAIRLNETMGVGASSRSGRVCILGSEWVSTVRVSTSFHSESRGHSDQGDDRVYDHLASDDGKDSLCSKDSPSPFQESNRRWLLVVAKGSSLAQARSFEPQVEWGSW